MTEQSARVAFGPAAAPLVVQVDAPEALPVVQSIFPDDRIAPGDATPSLRLRRAADGYVLEVRSVGKWHDPVLPAILARLELTLAEALVRAADAPGLHAAGVRVGPGAVLIVGPGGAGKSSLAAALAVRGMSVYGDDVVLLRNGHAHPFRRLLKVEEPARTLLGLPGVEGALARAWPDAAFYHPRALGSAWAEPAPVAAVILPRRTPSGATTLTPLRTADSLPAILSGLVMVDRVDASTFDAVASALAGARVYALDYAETVAAADALLDALA